MSYPQHDPLTADELEALLRPTATTGERVRGLLAIGVTPADLSRATGLTPAAVRNWVAAQAEPRPDAAITLDDLRAVAKILLDSEQFESEPERIAHWMRGWNAELQDRPLDVIASRPMEVRAAALGLVLAAA